MAILDDEAGKKEKGRMPPADFSGFVVSLAHAALVNMGELPDPVTGQTGRNIEQARYSIDLIDMIVEKTQGNLTAEEDVLLQRVVSDLKMKFVRSR